MTTTFDRREFLAGTFSALGGFLLPGCSFFAVPEGAVASFGKPNLIFGVVSDSHFRRAHASERPGSAFPTIYFRKALEYFRDQGADAVMHCGDMAHRGLVCEMRYYADIWRKVFPNDKGLDGKPVTRLFVTGNHDWIGSTYCDFGKEMYPDENVRKEKVLANDMARHWQAVWGEPYERGWHKCVKGYHFFGEHHEDSYCKLSGMIKENAEAYGLRGKKPFFILQHKIPRKGLRNVLRGLPNAVSFFGHWHQSNASDATVKFNVVPLIQCASLRGNGSVSPPGLAVAQKGGAARQGLLVKVYDTALVISRRDFTNGGSLGPDWVMPLGEYKPHPFSPKRFSETIGAPEFASGAKLELASSEQEIVIGIPAARASEKARAYVYDVAVVGDGGAKFNTVVFADGSDVAADNKQALGPTTVKVAAGDVPAGAKLKVTVKPISSLGVCGKPIEAEVASTVKRPEPKAEPPKSEPPKAEADKAAQPKAGAA